MISVLDFFRSPPQYARKESGKHGLHHVVVRRLRLAHSGKLHTFAQAHQAEGERGRVQAQWPVLALRQLADVRADLVELFVPERVKALLKPGVSTGE